jgi:hypothetical protein
MSRLVWIYRALYVLVLVVCGANSIKRSPLTFDGQMVGVLLLAATCLLLFGTVLITGIKNASSKGFVWAITFAWCALFSWNAWFSLSSPFVFHEAHTLDAIEAEAEAGRYNAIAIAIYILLLVWFLSFPLVQRVASRNRRQARA